MKCLIILLLITTTTTTTTSCLGGFKSREDICPIGNENKYKSYYQICLASVQNTTELVVMACDMNAYERTKYCY